MGDPLRELRDELTEAEALRRRADEATDRAVAAARKRGVTWAQIGDVIGVTRQAAQQRFSAAPDRADAGVQDALAAAAQIARSLGHHYVAPEHLLLALAGQRGELAGRALTELGVSAD